MITVVTVVVTMIDNNAFHFKDYLHYITILYYKVALNVQLMNFII